MTDDIRYEKVTLQNKKNANEIISQIFPEDADCAEVCFNLSIAPKAQWEKICREADNRLGTYFTEQFLPISYLEYDILKINEMPVGVSGIYSYIGEPDEAWTGWLGITPPERGKGYGHLLLQHVINRATQKGCNILRLWSTDSAAYHVAHCMYEKRGFMWQADPCDLPACEGERCRICGLNLQDSSIPVAPWYGYRTVGLAGLRLQPGVVLVDTQVKSHADIMRKLNMETASFKFNDHEIQNKEKDEICHLSEQPISRNVPKEPNEHALESAACPKKLTVG